MPSTTEFIEVRLTVSDLSKIQPISVQDTVDDAMLRQIRRIVPAAIAGVTEWAADAGDGRPTVWIRWEWYYDDVAEDYVIPPQGFASNITLVCPVLGTPLPRTYLFTLALRHLLKSIRWTPQARHDPVRGRFAGSPHALLRGGARQSPITVRPSHRDGTTAWGRKAALELEGLPESEQFDQIAKWARLKFDFDQTLLFCRSTYAPHTYAMDENHPPAWRDAYKKEDFARIDPRLHMASGPQAWCSRELCGKNPAFWEKAMHYGVACGVALPSMDSGATLVLSRSYGVVSAEELALITPSLTALAAFAHRLIHARLQGNAPPLRPERTPLLPDIDWEILHLTIANKHRKEIAFALGISLSSLDRRIKHIKATLGVSTMPAAIIEAQRLDYKR